MKNFEVKEFGQVDMEFIKFILIRESPAKLLNLEKG